MIIDGTDNADYFIYKFNLSKKDQKRLKSIDFFYKENVNLKILLKRTLIKFFIIMANKLYLILLTLNYSHLLRLKKNYLN
jgi:poly(A) polymerase